MNISIRASFPESAKYAWTESLKEFESIGSVEVAFYLPDLFLKNVEVEDVILPFKDLKLKCSSVHMAQARITEPFIFESILKKTVKIAKGLDCNTIVVHPSFARLEKVAPFIEGIVSPLLEKHGVYLCWETFSGKKRFLSGLEGIANFCRKREWHKVCFDFSHIHDDQKKILEDIDKCFDLINIFHVSNRVAEQKLQHLPIFYKNTDLDFHQIIRFLKAKNFSGNLVLEYLPEYHGFLKKDAQLLIEKYRL